MRRLRLRRSRDAAPALPAEARAFVQRLPSRYQREQVEREIGRYTDWFYEFEFTNGARTVVADAFVRATHEIRAALVFPRLEEAFGHRWPEVECLDMACHEGWFSLQVAVRNARRVYGIDVREEHVARAALMAELAGLERARFEQRDLYGLSSDPEEGFDLTLFLGILYHLEDPVGALKVARAMTKELCVIETQVARPTPALTYMWGPDPNARTGPAIALGGVDERHVAEGGAVVLVPTLDALFALLEGVGFSRVELAPPPAGAPEQYARLDRVVVFATP
jgi:tRNA (mo5U34)-methyltransferase